MVQYLKYLALLALCTFGTLYAQTDPVKASLIYEEAAIQPGRPIWIGIKLSLEENWHAYWKNPGDAGMPLEIEWSLPKDFNVEKVEWPTPIRMASNEQIAFGYEGEFILLAKIIPPNTLSDKNFEIAADLSWVICSESTCLPGGTHVSTQLPHISADPKPLPSFTDDFARARSKIPQNNEEITAYHDGVYTSFKIETKSKLIGASFFPETLEDVDHTTDAILSPISWKENKYLIIIKNRSPIDTIKGVLSLQVENTPHQAVLAYNIDMPVKVVENGSIANTLGSDHDFKGGFFLALGLAFLGGLILNLMPCVLPVISFKILSFVKMSGRDRKLIFKHGLSFAAGILLSFWVLAGVLLLLQSSGRVVGWGFQLQEPIFVAILASIIFIFGLSLFGLFEMGVGLASKAGDAQTKSKSEGLIGSFFSGILATAIATPCTGPFLGTAIGFAVTLPAIQSMLIFSSLGIGMAFPYLIVGAFPSFIRFLPKPGNWMITFKEIMGFIMLATVLWLMWVFVAQTSGVALFQVLVAFFLFATSAWIFGKWCSPVNSKKVRIFCTACALFLFTSGGYAIYEASTLDYSENHEEIALADEKDPIVRWEKFSKERLEELQQEGTPVFIDFTAKWCLICQANHVTLSTAEVTAKFAEKGVVKMKADWTKNNPEITEHLKKYGRNGVPLYLLYTSDARTPPAIMPQTLTPAIVLDYLDKL